MIQINEIIEKICYYLKGQGYSEAELCKDFTIAVIASVAELDNWREREGLKAKDYLGDLRRYWDQHKKLPELFSVSKYRPGKGLSEDEINLLEKEEGLLKDFLQSYMGLMMSEYSNGTKLIEAKYRWPEENNNFGMSAYELSKQEWFKKQEKEKEHKERVLQKSADFPILASEDITKIFYDPYTELLKNESTYKKHMASMIRKNLPDLNSVVERHLKDVKIYHSDYKEQVKQMVISHSKYFGNHGIINAFYQSMGYNPTIAPADYSVHLNNVKKTYRHKIYELMPNLNPHYTILSFDFVPCYNSILLNLYPEKLVYIKQATETTSLLEMLKNEFKKAGKETIFNEPAVKECIYNGFFLGGSYIMVKGILGNFKDSLNYIPNRIINEKGFKQLSYYDTLYDQARKIADFLSKNPIVNDYLSVANFIKKTYDGKYLVGPTGHYYKINNKKNFISAYICLLRSYEFYIISKASLDLKEKFPEVEFIGNYQDENALAVPAENVEAVKNYYINRVKQIGFELKLFYPVKLEVKAEYRGKAF